MEITEIHIDWPVVNEKLKKIELDHNRIWDGEDFVPPTDITSGFKDDYTVASGNSEEIKFGFDEDVATSGYSLRIEFDYGCSVNVSE